MKHLFCILFLIGAFAFAGAVSAKAECWVSTDGGNLNVRARPNGRIIGKIANGTRVHVTETINDRNGDPWSFVRTSTRRTGYVTYGWSASEYISCR